MGLGGFIAFKLGAMGSHRPFRLPVNTGLLWTASIACAYLLLWRLVTHWSGKWPAPYWFAVGLGVLLAYGLLVGELKHLVWVTPLACLAALVSWFFSLGIYQIWRKAWLGRWWAQLDDWEQNLPALISMAAFVAALLFLRAADKGWRLLVSFTLFACVFFAMSVFANLACSICLPADGTFGFGSFDHDIFGFRLGAYYVFMVAVSVSLLRVASTRMGVIRPNNALQRTSK